MHTINFLGFTSVWCYLVRVYIHLYVFFQIKVYINYGKCHVELVSMYLLCLYFSPGQFGNMKYWHFSSHWIDFIQIWPQTNGGPNTERYPAKKKPKTFDRHPVQGIHVYYLKEMKSTFSHLLFNIMFLKQFLLDNIKNIVISLLCKWTNFDLFIVLHPVEIS